MTDGTSEVKYKRFIEEMNAVEVRKTVNEKTIAILVFGACENHGDHMPFGSDFFSRRKLQKDLLSRSIMLLFFLQFHMESVYIMTNFR